MKTVKFRPLRRIAKTGKIVVASYMQWRKVKSADYREEFSLEVFGDFKNFKPDEPVHNHKGERLFWYNHLNPDALPKNTMTLATAATLFGIDPEHFAGEEWKVSQPLSEGFHSSVRGFDCDGVPVFSHYTSKYIATHYEDVSQFEPLTVGLVVKWYGWFLWKLNNSRLKTK